MEHLTHKKTFIFLKMITYVLGTIAIFSENPSIVFSVILGISLTLLFIILIMYLNRAKLVTYGKLYINTSIILALAVLTLLMDFYGIFNGFSLDEIGSQLSSLSLNHKVKYAIIFVMIHTIISAFLIYGIERCYSKSIYFNTVFIIVLSVVTVSDSMLFKGVIASVVKSIEFVFIAVIHVYMVRYRIHGYELETDSVNEKLVADFSIYMAYAMLFKNMSNLSFVFVIANTILGVGDVI